MSYEADRLLVIYSSPIDGERLRVDVEQRELRNALEVSGVGVERVTFLQAARFEDIINELSRARYTAIQFSGHSSKKELILESSEGSQSTALRIDDFSTIIQIALPEVRLVVFMSCYSSNFEQTLAEHIPYIIAVDGPADDDACVKFSSQFHPAMLKNGDISSAMSRALFPMNMYRRASDGHDFTAVLFRRDIHNKNNVLIDAVRAKDINSKDEILVDVRRVEDDLNRLGIDRIDFISNLANKIQMHRWAFRYPRENALFSAGLYFCLLSWSNAKDRVTCEQVMKFRESATEQQADVWASLIVSYHDSYVAPYRAPDALQSGQFRYVSDGLTALQGTLVFYFLDEERAAVLRGIDAESFKAIKAQLGANLSMAQKKLDEGMHGQCISFMEVALSTIHDLINSIAKKLLV